MKRLLWGGILGAAAVAAYAGTRALDNVYSLAIYAGGTSYRDLCSFNFPFSQYHFQITERSWYEDTNGFTIMGTGGPKEEGDVLHRMVDFEIGPKLFTVSRTPVKLQQLKPPLPNKPHAADPR
jgi:hypothetical protein